MKTKAILNTDAISITEGLPIVVEIIYIDESGLYEESTNDYTSFANLEDAQSFIQIYNLHLDFAG